MKKNYSSLRNIPFFGNLKITLFFSCNVEDKKLKREKKKQEKKNKKENAQKGEKKSQQETKSSKKGKPPASEQAKVNDPEDDSPKKEPVAVTESEINEAKEAWNGKSDVESIPKAKVTPV